MIRPAFALLLFLSAATAAAADGLADRIAALPRAYPAQITAVSAGVLTWRDGTQMALSDGRDSRSFAEMLHNGSILDQLREPYPLGPLTSAPEPGDDPGRVRNRAFFDRMYGDCIRGEVAPRLVPVTWLPRNWGHTVMMTSVNGVADQLAAISQALDQLPPADIAFLHPLGGTYKCRSVADTGEPSMHAYGAAIDINVSLSDYWLWEHSAGPRHQTPPDIVAIFEKHGFIWGGKWSHYDTMHFEYRPELLPPP